MNNEEDMKFWLDSNYSCAEKTYYIGNGVDEVFFNAGIDRRYFNSKPVVNFICVGNLIPRKNTQFIFQVRSIAEVVA